MMIFLNLCTGPRLASGGGDPQSSAQTTAKRTTEQSEKTKEVYRGALWRANPKMRVKHCREEATA